MGNSKINHKNHLDNSVVNVEKLLPIDEAFPIGAESGSVQNEYSELVSFDEAFTPTGNEAKPKEQNFVEFSAKNQYNHYVKNDQDALKGVIMAEFNLTEEMAKALSTEIRSKALQLQNNQNSSPTMFPPEAAPELYDDRPIDEETGKRETPIKFYERVWKEYADGGVLFQDSLRKLDAKLVDAIHSYCQRNSLAASEHLPPPKARRTELSASGNSKEAIKAQIALLKRQL